MIATTKQTVRCAIYTRKSTEENLKLDFNSLDAQRDSGENYIKSQVDNGWVLIDEHYDDAGFTGKNTERPAFQRLMNDVREGKIDVIVIYKLDRFSRSIRDFVNTLAELEEHNVSIICVTQPINTTGSMGRLLLNILMCFAQFEREMTSERTRDKIVAARRKGKWTGGPPVLGYNRVRDETGSRLVVNQHEAVIVNDIFQRYLSESSLLRVVQWLDSNGVRNKQYTTTKGTVRGGKDFDKSTIQKILRNPLYLGKITFNDQMYEGQHDAIVDEDTFGQVQGMLRRNRTCRGQHQRRNKHNALLKGLVLCKHCECLMSHHFTRRNKKQYRYYVCRRAQMKGWKTCPAPSLPAIDLEEFVLNKLRELCGDADLLLEIVAVSRGLIESQTDEINAKIRPLKQQVKRLNLRLCELAPQEGQDGVIEEMADLTEQMRHAENELTELNGQLATARKRLMDEDELLGAGESFDPMWQNLKADEKQRLIHLLIQQIEYDAENEAITITYHPGILDVLNIPQEADANE